MDDKKINEEIERKFNELQNFKEGSEEQSRATNDLIRLIKLRSEIIAETDKSAQQKFDNWVKIAVAGAGLVSTFVSLAVYTKLFYVGLEFEKTGAITSSFVKGAINLFKPKI